MTAAGAYGGLPLKIELEETGGSLEWDEIVALEAHVGARFPDDLRDFLKSCNGGRAKPNVIDVKSYPAPSEFKIKVNWFLRVCDTRPSFTLRSAWELWRNTGHPVHVLPFATDIVGSQFCISLAGDDRESVYYHNYYGDGPDSGCRYRDCYPVTTGFTDFLDMICPQDSWRS
ncbi:MAG TPA: SMI1/KNR4 family protein [Phycisphaerae bacterium]|nr:SMI1/KNR4 family protein [Phycisphaerae bacterium]HRW54599.1 SMI1/KNR4 family protein [Phycisphaerae bacterium]